MLKYKSPPSDHFPQLAIKILGRRTTPFLLALILGCIAPLGTYAEIYSWVDDNGNKVFSDQKPSTDAKVEIPSNNGNYYTVDKLKTAAQDLLPAYPVPAATAHRVDTNTVDSNDSEQDSKLSEASCQQVYALSCDQVYNWKRTALELCGDDKRCDNEEYLERKYKPLPTEEILKIARGAAIRNNRQNREISEFLKRKYTDFCDQQASFVCSSNDINCNQTVLNACNDPREIGEILAKFTNLTDTQKREIISQARQLTLQENNNPTAYSAMLRDLLDLLIAGTVLGL